jgi:hypothetical protein
VVKDATADYSDDAMHAALDVNMTNYAAIMTTNEVVESMASLVDVSAQNREEADRDPITAPSSKVKTGRSCK